MIVLRLFGGMSLIDEGRQAPARATQRRRLALLAYLVVAKGKPVSRDKLVAIFWPEADTERARHLLADSIYVLRDALGADILVTSGDDVSLNAALVASDVAEFAAALQDGNRVRATELYRDGGPFLDGIHLAGAPEFERWTESIRSQFDADYRRSLEELAAQCTASGAHHEAAVWWRQLAAVDRLNSRIAQALMRSLASSGDIAGALEFAVAHERIIRAELEVGADPAVAALAAELRLAGERPVVSNTSVNGARYQPAESPEKVTPDVVRPAEVARRSIKRRLAYAAVILSLSVIAFALGRAPGHRVDLVVLPLENGAAGPESQTMSEGMTEELIDELTRDGLSVIAPTSAFMFDASHADARTIGDSLHVSNVLRGSVQRSGSSVRLRVELIDAVDRSTRWSGTFDPEVSGVFAAYDSIGHAVAAVLKRNVPPRGDRHTTRVATANGQAYDMFLRGRVQMQRRNDPGFVAALDYFSDAVAADSDFAAAYAGLAVASWQHGVFGGGPVDQRRALFARAEASAERAVRLDDALPDAHFALGSVRMFWRIDVGAAEHEMQRALALDPAHQLTHEYLAILYGSTERPVQALTEARRAVDLDPLSVTSICELGHALLNARRYDEALTQLRRCESLGVPALRAAVLLGQAYVMKHMFPQAISEFSVRRGILARAMLGNALARSGDKAGALKILDEIRSQSAHGAAGAWYMAVVYAGLGNRDSAFVNLEKSFDDTSMRLDIMSPPFDDLRADPRFESVKARLGFRKP